MKLSLTILSATSLLLIGVGCVSPKKLRTAEAKYAQLDSAYVAKQNELRDCQGNLKNSSDQKTDLAKQKADLLAKIDDLNKQIDFLKKNNTQVLDQLKDLSVVSGAQAESIKQSLSNLNAKDSYIANLQSSLARKDSLNMALVMNLKSALSDVNDTDINIKVEKDVVYIDISDKLLFNSGSYTVTNRAKYVLGKVAKVLNAHPNIEFMVEGNTDSKPYRNGVLLDNWDLSVKRATAVTRILQNNYQIDPRRITAAGRSEYAPVAPNDTKEGRAANRRTRIIILPQLDQFFKLLEKNNQ
ncbi:OmpA family protein [Hydrotalea sp.]|uniref:OmpA/MotB family protein n=1 Tax=Hydrotalea sp. TaxID=2881279 RepID=UPI003D0C4682